MEPAFFLQALVCSLAVLLVAGSAQAARKLPYPAASNAKDIPTLSQLGTFPGDVHVLSLC